MNEDSLYELCAFTDFITEHNKSASTQDIKLTDMYKILKNPYNHLNHIHRISRYLTNKHGILREALRILKSISTLNYHLVWSTTEDPERIRKYDRKVDEFLDDLNIKKVVRDGIFELGELGTIPLCNRKNAYVQFLELDEVRINKQRNGRWVVEYDLFNLQKTFAVSKMYESLNNRMAVYQSLPDEVDERAYQLYLEYGENYRFVELSNCDVLNLDANRNYPYGLPFAFGAWIPLLQKEIINRVERSVSDRLIKQILILSAGNIGGEQGKPAPKKLIEHYFNQVKELINKKENGFENVEGETSGSGVVALPDFFDLDTLNVDTKMFTKDLYNKIDSDILQNLGISSALLHGGGDTTHSTAQINNEKLQKYVHTILEDFEQIFNRYIKSIIPKTMSCRIRFKKPVFADEKQIEQAFKMYQTVGIARPWIELSTGMNMEEFISMAKYEKEVLQTEKYLYPPTNPFTSSGNDNEAGRPADESLPTNDNTAKNKNNNGNGTPKPSQQ